MAKLKKKPIEIDSSVKIEINPGKIGVSGPLGQLSVDLPEYIEAGIMEGQLTLKNKSENGKISLLGLHYGLLKNAVVGVKDGWRKTLEMVGVGFRAQTDGQKLTLNVGFSHPVNIIAPQGISFKVVENKITVEGANKYLVGEIAAAIKRVKPPEPYKGKGIKYLGEKIRKKAGKAAKAVGGAGAK